MLTNRI
jgi:hypothetical protein